MLKFSLGIPLASSTNTLNLGRHESTAGARFRIR